MFVSLNTASITKTQILKEICSAPFATIVDQLRPGMDQEVTGIVTTMFATIEIIGKTAKAGANFIIGPFAKDRIGYDKKSSW